VNIAHQTPTPGPRASGKPKVWAAAVAILVFANLSSAATLANMSGKILGLVTDAAGSPQMGAAVTLLTSQDKFYSRTLTDDKGAFSFDGLAAGACYYVCMGWEHLSDVLRSLAARDSRAYSVLVWDRLTPRITSYPQDYIPVCEFIAYGWKRGHQRKRPSAGAEQTTIWRIKTESSADMDHPTQKPVALIANGLLNSRDPGDAMLDLFGGSGSALVAAEQLDRRGLIMEIEPAYCDVIVRRWERVTGGQAVKANP